MNERELDILDSLFVTRDTGRSASTNHQLWLRPMDVGGRDGSHHSATLRNLVRRGWANAYKRHAIYCSVGMTERQRWDAGSSTWIVTDGHPPAPCRCKGSIVYHISPRALRFCYERIE